MIKSVYWALLMMVNLALAEETIEIHVYNHSHYRVEMFQELDHNEHWDNYGGLDVRTRNGENDVILPNKSEVVELKDNNGAFSSFVTDRDHFGLRLRDRLASSSVPVYKNVYFGVVNPERGAPFVNIASNWQTEKACIYLDSSGPDAPAVYHNCGFQISGGSVHSFDVNVYDDYIVVGSRIGIADARDIAGKAAAVYQIGELLTPDPLQYDKQIYGSIYAALKYGAAGKLLESALSFDDEQQRLILNGVGLYSVGMYSANAQIVYAAEEPVTPSMCNGEQVSGWQVTPDVPPHLFNSSLIGAVTKFGAEHFLESTVLAQAVYASLPYSLVQAAPKFYDVAGIGLDSMSNLDPTSLKVDPATLDIVAQEVGAESLLIIQNPDQVEASTGVMVAYADLINCNNLNETMTSPTLNVSRTQSVTTTVTSGWSNQVTNTASGKLDLKIISGGYTHSVTTTVATGNDTAHTDSKTVTYTLPAQSPLVPAKSFIRIKALVTFGEARGTFSYHGPYAATLRANVDFTQVPLHKQALHNYQFNSGRLPW